MAEILGTSATESERHALSALVAGELKALGLPEQAFEIQASYLTFAALDLGIRLVWPLTMEFQGSPTGIIQIAAKKRTWKPESRVVITFARLMGPERLRDEIREWCRVQTAMVRKAVEGKGGIWPHEWPRLEVKNAQAVNEMPTKPGTIVRQGQIQKLRKRR